MDRTLVKLELLGGKSNFWIGMKDEFDTDFTELKFDFNTGFIKHNSRNHITIGEGKSFRNRGGVIFTFIGVQDGLIIFNIQSNHSYYPSVNTNIYVRPGVVGIYLDVEEISIGSKAIYNIDKSTEEYVLSRFNKVPEITFGKMDTIIYDVYQDTERIHDGVEERVGNRLYIYRPSYLISYEIVGSKINLIQLECEDESYLPTLYKELHELMYKLTVNHTPNIDTKNL